MIFTKFLKSENKSENSTPKTNSEASKAPRQQNWATYLCCCFPVSKASASSVLLSITVIPVAAAATDRVLRMRKRLALRVLPCCSWILNVVVDASVSEKKKFIKIQNLRKLTFVCSAVLSTWICRLDPNFGFLADTSFHFRCTLLVFFAPCIHPCFLHCRIRSISAPLERNFC